MEVIETMLLKAIKIRINAPKMWISHMKDRSNGFHVKLE